MIDIATVRAQTWLEREQVRNPGLIGLLMSLPGPLVWTPTMDYARRCTMIESVERKGKVWKLTVWGDKLLNDHLKGIKI